MTDYSSNSLLIISKEITTLINHIQNLGRHFSSRTISENESKQIFKKINDISNIFSLLDYSYLAKFTQRIQELIIKIVDNDSNLATKNQAIKQLHISLTSLKKHIEITNLLKKRMPELLLPDLNQIEIVLKKPITTFAEYLNLSNKANELIPIITSTKHVEPSHYIHFLYKLGLNNLFNSKDKKLNFDQFKDVSIHMAYLSWKKPSQNFWQLLNHIFFNFNKINISSAVLQTLIEIESSIYHFLNSPNSYLIPDKLFADIVYLCISLNDELSLKLCKKLNLSDNFLNDNELEHIHSLIHQPTVDELNSYSNLIFKNLYQIDSKENSLEILNLFKSNLHQLEGSFKKLNMESEFIELQNEMSFLSSVDSLSHDSFTQLNTLIFKIKNDIEIKKRQHFSSQIQFQVHNPYLSIQFLDDAFSDLLVETQKLISTAVNEIYFHLNAQNVKSLEKLPYYFKKVAYTFLYLEQPIAYQILNLNKQFIEQQLKQQDLLEKEQIKLLLHSLASAELYLEHLMQNQAIPLTIFTVALESSKTLRSAA
ncbi:hypothetical protein [Acinetobacter equi]|uniref:Chemotaxis protein n=1 Tax=Acinetobacter equi TaxID=1324350 RepID=A0A0N9W2G9_9GAMM|nr:hypothetical protein [Acinetobacter equi]ALH95770.1 hypothetical protein AOY20_09630 [Acinetobacter equi]